MRGERGESDECKELDGVDEELEARLIVLSGMFFVIRNEFGDFRSSTNICLFLQTSRGRFGTVERSRSSIR